MVVVMLITERKTNAQTNTQTKNYVITKRNSWLTVEWFLRRESNRRLGWNRHGLQILLKMLELLGALDRWK